MRRRNPDLSGVRLYYPQPKEVKGMERLRTPLMVQAIYLILLCISTLTPSIAASVYGSEVKDPGVLLVLSSVFLGFGVVVWVAASNAEKYGGLATAFVAALLISAIFLAWAWATGLFTARTALVPIVLNVVLAAWVWSARPKS
jgi:hypothetical protein